MSTEIRNALAAAANTVEGVKAQPYFRQTTRAGDAFVRLDRWARDTTGFGYMETWGVCVVLPQDLEAAEKYLDEKLDALVSAIEKVLVVTTVTPSRLQLDTGVLPVVIIEGNRAH